MVPFYFLNTGSYCPSLWAPLHHETVEQCLLKKKKKLCLPPLLAGVTPKGYKTLKAIII